VRPAANAGIFQIAAAEARVTDRLLTAEFAEHLGLRRVFCVCATAENSYDVLDNLGRGSPKELTPGADELEAGQRVMTIFHLASFAQDRHITIVCDGIGKKLSAMSRARTPWPQPKTGRAWF